MLRTHILEKLAGNLQTVTECFSTLTPV